MKRLLAVLVFSALSVKADTFGDWQYSVTNGQAAITGYTGSGGAVTIPSSVNGVSVTSIGQNAFFNRTNLTSVTIPDSVTSIGLNAFRQNSLTSITIGNSVTSIGGSAFLLCSNLTSVTIPNSVTSIGLSAFQVCTNLTSVTIGNSVTSIGGSAFSGCTSLTSLTIPNSVTSIGGSAFSGCSNLTSVTIGNCVTSIGDKAFESCTSLTSPTIPNSVTSIWGSAFSGCTSLTSLTIPNSVTSIGGSAFSGCTSLTIVTIPDRFLSQISTIGISGQLATDVLINGLANNDAFVTAVANKIKGTGGNYGIATQSGLSNTISTTTSNLATKTELANALAQSRTDGINSVISNPNLWTLYTTNQISAMAIGDLVLTRTNNGSFVLNYDIEQSEDLVNWTPYQGFAMPLTNLPTNKAFVRIKAKQ